MTNNSKTHQNVIKCCCIFVFIGCLILLFLLFLKKQDKNEEKTSLEEQIESFDEELEDKSVNHFMEEKSSEKIKDDYHNKIFYDKDFSSSKYGFKPSDMRIIYKNTENMYDRDRMEREKTIAIPKISRLHTQLRSILIKLKENKIIDEKDKYANQTYCTGSNLSYEHILNGNKFDAKVVFEKDKIVYFLIKAVDNSNMFIEFLLDDSLDIIKFLLTLSSKNYSYIITNKNNEPKLIEVLDDKNNISLEY